MNDKLASSNALQKCNKLSDDLHIRDIDGMVWFVEWDVAPPSLAVALLRIQSQNFTCQLFPHLCAI